MGEIQIPFPLKGIPVKPELSGRVKIDETMIQTLAALCGWNGEARRLLTCALNGALQTTSPVAAAIINKLTTGADEHITFVDTPTSEIIVMSNANNSGEVWLNLDAAAGLDTGWLLDPGDFLNISVNNLSRIRLFVVTSGDKAIILHTV